MMENYKLAKTRQARKNSPLLRKNKQKYALVRTSTHDLAPIPTKFDELKNELWRGNKLVKLLTTTYKQLPKKRSYFQLLPKKTQKHERRRA